MSHLYSRGGSVVLLTPWDKYEVPLSRFSVKSQTVSTYVQLCRSSQKSNCANYGYKLLDVPKVKSRFQCTDFDETHKCWTVLCSGHLYPKINIKRADIYICRPLGKVWLSHWAYLCGNYAWSSFSQRAFRENPTDGLIGDTKSRTDGRTWSSLQASLFYFLKNA
jgi:hypothetical protein